MTRAHFVKAARKDNPVAKKGESYWWWQFAFGPKQYSKEQPKPQQLTRSEFQAALLDLEDRLNALVADDSLASEVQSLIEDIESLAGEQEDKLNNMPDSLQQGPTGELLQSRVDGLQDWAAELRNIDFEFDDESARSEIAEDDAMDDDDKDRALEDKRDEFWQERLEEVQATSYSGE